MNKPFDIRAIADDYGQQCMDPALGVPSVRTLLGKLNLELVLHCTTVEGLDGLVVPFGDTGVVFINESQPARRRLWTMAHECGHWILHREIISQGDFIKSYQHEREAHEFAAHFLLPETLVHQWWSDEPWADVLARRFKVSIDAMIRRLLGLGLPIRFSSDWEEPAHLALIGKDWPPDLPDLFLEDFPLTTLNDKKTRPNCKSVAKRKEALFCWNCGTPLTNRCDRCNTILDSEDRYCELCGEPSYYHRNHLGIVTI